MLHTDALVNLITKKQGVSIVEVLNELRANGVDVDGEIAAFWPYDPIVLWPNVTQEAIEELKALLADPRIDVMSTDPLVYMIDGVVPQIPLANAKSVARRHPYKSERWLPVVFNPKS